MKTYKFEIFTAAIEKNIREGIFKAGHKLPSVRELKELYAISISTIQSGYDYLVVSGLVESVPKSGYYVSNRVSLNNGTKSSKPKQIVRDPIFKTRSRLSGTYAC